MKLQRDNEEQKIEFMQNMQNFVTGEKLQIAVFASGVGKSIAGLVIMLFILTRSNFFNAFERTEDSFMMAFGTGLRVMLYIFTAILVLSLIQNVIALVIVFRGDEATPYGSKYLRIVTAIKSGLSFLIMTAFGLIFGGMGAFAAFAKNVQKDNAVEVIGFIFMLIGIGMVIYSLVSCVQSIKKDLESTDQNI